MRTMQTMLLVCLVVAFTFVAVAQTTNGTGGGKWSLGATWAGGVVPTGSGTITIAATDSIIYDVAVTITGTLVKNSTRKDSIGTGGSLTFASGSTYTHAVNGGTITTATWANGSTCIITGTTSTAPSNANQNFYNFTWNCPGQTGGLNVGWNGNTIGGDLNVLGTGAIGNGFRMSSNTYGQTAGSPNVITINGNVNLSGVSYLTATGSGTPVHYTQVVVNGNFNGIDPRSMFQLANGSGCFGSWWMKGNVAFACSLATNNTNPDTLVFCGTGVQTLTSNVEMNNFNIVIYPGAQVAMGSSSNMGTSKALSFTMANGATFICGGNGLSSNISLTTGTITFGTACNFVFNGLAAQVTSAIMPATAYNVTINNASGVTSSQSLTITNSLFNVLGTLSGPYTASKTSTDVQENLSGMPQEFFVNQNYPNPFNPSTMISYGLPKESFVSLKVYNLMGQEVATLVSSNQTAGKYTVPFDASRFSSGVYMYRLQAGSSVEVKRMMFVK